MTCEEARERMVFHVDGEDEEVGLHLRACPACSALRDEVAAERALIRRALAEEVAVARTPASQHARRIPPRWATRRAAPYLLPLAVAAAAILAWVSLLRPSRPQARPPAKEVAAEPRATDPTPPSPPSAPAPRPEPPRAPEVAPERRPQPPPASEPQLPPLPAPPKPLPPPAPDSPKPAPPTPATPEKAEKRARVALTLERGTVRGPKWEGTRVFTAGETIQAQTALRVGWASARIYIKEGSSVTVAAQDGVSLESGAVLVENVGTPFSVRTPHASIQDLGTRFLVTVAGRETEAVVYEGRVACRAGDASRDAVAGERAVVKDSGVPSVEPARDPGAYPAWMARVAKVFTAALRLTFDKREALPLEGRLQDGRLYALEDGPVLNAGASREDPIFTVRTGSEYWVTYCTASTEPVILRCRALKPESVAFDFAIAKPVPNRPVAIRVPLDRFRSLDGRSTLAPGDRVHILYVFTSDLKARLWIDDLSIVEPRD